MAGKMLDKHIIADSNFPSLINLMHYNAQGEQTITFIHRQSFNSYTHRLSLGGPTVSGLDDHDYPNLSGASMNFANINQMRMHGKVPLPSEVMEHFGRILFSV